MVSACIGAVSFSKSGMRFAKATYPGELRKRAGPATRISTSKRSSQPVVRSSLSLLTTRGVLARRRRPFRLRGQSIRFIFLPLMDRPDVGRGRFDRAVPADRLRAQESADVDHLVVCQ